MINLGCKINGGAALNAAMQRLPAKIEANVMRGALRDGAKAVRDDAEQRIKSRSGRLAASVRIGTIVRNGRVTAYVRAGKGGKKGAAVFYAHMVEFGTAAHVIKAPPGAKLRVNGLFFDSVNHPGARKSPFLRPALDTKASDALSRATGYARRRLATKYGIETPDPQEGDE